MNRATSLNIQRKSALADRVQLLDGCPLPSWIDINITELCNRTCVFCPRTDPKVYPNQNLNMSVALARKIGTELRSIEYKGAVILSGFGEPLLHPRVVEVARAVGRGLHLELVTNGDSLTVRLIRELCEAGVKFFAVSMYDGPEQQGKLHSTFVQAGCTEDVYLLRDRWHGPDTDFGLKLTNRAGTVASGNQPLVRSGCPCFYTAYSAMVDWDGGVLLCVQDWNKKVRFGNLSGQSLVEVWTSSAFQKWRARLARGDRSWAPCSGCNADGTVHGSNHVRAWNL